MSALVQESGGEISMVSRVARMTRPISKQWSRQIVPTPPRRPQGLGLGLFLDQLDGAHEALEPDLADQRVIEQVLEARLEIGAGLVAHALDDLLLLQDADVLDGDGAGDGM